MLEVLLFILPGFASVILLISSKDRKIRRLGAEYWIFLSLVCLISSISIFGSFAILNLFSLIWDFLETTTTWGSGLRSFIVEYGNRILLLNNKIVLDVTFAPYLLSFYFAKKFIRTKYLEKFLAYVDGTEEVDNFLEPLVGEDANNTAMITLECGKVFICTIVAGDVHKKIENDSITIIPLMSGSKNSVTGKLRITTSNLKPSIEGQTIKLNPVYKDLKNNIALSKVSYISKFVLTAFCSYLANDQIEWEDSTNEPLKVTFTTLHEQFTQSDP